MEEKPPKETEKGLLGLGVGGQNEKSKRMMLWKEGKQFHEGKGHLQCQSLKLGLAQCQMELKLSRLNAKSNEKTQGFQPIGQCSPYTLLLSRDSCSVFQGREHSSITRGTS